MPGYTSTRRKVLEVSHAPSTGIPLVKPGAKGYQMQQVIETHLPHLSRPQLTGLVLWGVRCYSGRQRLPERRGLGTLSLGQMEQPAPVSPGVVVRRQRPGPSLPDRTGRKSLLPPLLRWVLAWWRSGRLALAVDPRSKATKPLPSSSAWSTAVALFPWPGASTGPPSGGPGWTPRWNSSGNSPQRFPRK